MKYQLDLGVGEVWNHMNMVKVWFVGQIFDGMLLIHVVYDLIEEVRMKIDSCGWKWNNHG